jgi:hypothetical protein
VSRAAIALLAAALAGAALLASGCSLQLRAEKLKVEAGDGSIRLVEPTDGKLRSGEVVITIVNATSDRRQFTLARTDARPAALPQAIRDAYSYRDDPHVVAVTGVMRGAEVQHQFGSIPRQVQTETKLHVHLHPNTTYLLFDRLGGYRHGYALRLEAPR